ncbi:MAG: glycosyltransferase [bacterium]|nr:glycosyltransferase [bacterium]
MSARKKKLARKLTLRGLLFIGLAFLMIAIIDFVLGVRSEHAVTKIDAGYYNNVIGRDKVLALTFDDGPDPVKTRQIMDILERQEIPATFFFMGSSSLTHPEIVKETANRGYEIGNHTYSHSWDVHQSKERLELELDVTNKIISNITGQDLILYRPPFLLDIGSDAIADPGGHSEKLAWAEDAGYIPVGADIDSLDWAANSSQEVIDNVMSSLDHGHIILLHDGGEGKYTIDALEPLITELKSEGYKFTTVSEIIGMHSAPEMLVSEEIALNDTDEVTSGDVTRLQTFLLKENFFPLEPNGIFEEETLASLTAWQEREGILGETGKTGIMTRAKIVTNLEQYEYHISPVAVVLNSSFERKLQSFSITFSSLTGKNIPLLMKVVLGFVVLRVVFIGLMIVAAKLKPKQVNGFWRGGVSVIIPVYNEQENIAATIDSVLKNKRRLMEIIVVNDGSTDGSLKVIRKIQAKHRSIIKVIKIKNSGKAAALNVGIQAARFGVIVTMDGDTIFTPDTIEHLVRPFGDKTVAGVAGKVCVTDAKNLLNHFQHLEYVIAQNVDKVAFNYLNAVGVIPGPVGAWRKSVVLAQNGYSHQTLVEDQDLTLAVLSSGSKVLYQPLARAYTETPYTLNDFIKQRMRWVFGTIQCLYKYRSHAVKTKSKSLQLVVLPNTLIYSVILPLLYPLLDVMLVASLAINFFDQYWPVYIAFMLADLLYAFIAFKSEKGNRKLLLLLPFQRIFYRFVIYYVVLVSVLKAIEGSEALWNKVSKRGDASKQHFSILDEELNVARVVSN